MNSNDPFTLNEEHHRWARKAQRKYGSTKAYWLQLIKRQRGRCAFSGALLRFDAASGTPQTGGPGAHPLYAAVDHCAPGSEQLGHEIVSYDLNDIKGCLPSDCFADLRERPSWRKLVRAWARQAEHDPENRAAFRAIRRPEGSFTR